METLRYSVCDRSLPLNTRAKIAFSDDDVALLSSANLTGHAMDSNMEAGLLIRGGRRPNKSQVTLECLDRYEGASRGLTHWPSTQP